MNSASAAMSTRAANLMAIIKCRSFESSSVTATCARGHTLHRQLSKLSQGKRHCRSRGNFALYLVGLLHE